MVDHEIDELACLGAEIVIHFSRFFDHESLVADRLGISVGKYEFFVVCHDPVNADALRLRLIKFFAKRNDLFSDLLAERRDLFLTVVAPALL